MTDWRYPRHSVLSKVHSLYFALSSIDLGVALKLMLRVEMSATYAKIWQSD